MKLGLLSMRRRTRCGIAAVQTNAYEQQNTSFNKQQNQQKYEQNPRNESRQVQEAPNTWY